MTFVEFAAENPFLTFVAWAAWACVSWVAFFAADIKYRKYPSGAIAPAWFHVVTAVILSVAWPALATLSALGALFRVSPDWMLDKVLVVLFPWWVSYDGE